MCTVKKEYIDALMGATNLPLDTIFLIYSYDELNIEFYEFITKSEEGRLFSYKYGTGTADFFNYISHISDIQNRLNKISDTGARVKQIPLFIYVFEKVYQSENFLFLESNYDYFLDTLLKKVIDKRLIEDYFDRKYLSKVKGIANKGIRFIINNNTFPFLQIIREYGSSELKQVILDIIESRIVSTFFGKY